MLASTEPWWGNWDLMDAATALWLPIGVLGTLVLYILDKKKGGR